MSLRILIVDDEAPARARMAALLGDLANECAHELCASLADGPAALAWLESTPVDLVLLDVQIPGMSGIELARRIADLPKPPAVIFVTAFDDYAVNAFEVRATDYLLKPVRASRLAAALRRVIDARNEATTLANGAATLTQSSPTRSVATLGGEADKHSLRAHFSVQERGRLLLVPVAEVLYLKAELKYLTLRTATRQYLLEASLLTLEAQFEEVFVRVHRNTLVARAAIIGVERIHYGGESGEAGQAAQVGKAGTERHASEAWQVILRDLDERLPISRRQWSTVKALVR